MARPAALARMLRERSGLTALPLDIEALLSWCPVQLAEVPLDGCLGLFVRRPTAAGILISDKQRRSQRRFTIAHELGHFAMPTHAREGPLQCLARDLDHRAGGVEAEANEFAAELLMPQSVFALDIEGRDPTFALVKELASGTRYDVSITACAYRFIELTGERAALVCSHAGKVLWQRRSRDFYLPLPTSGQRLHPDTAAAAVCRGEAPDDGAEAVPIAAWTTPREDNLTMLESTATIPSLGQVLSLLFVAEE